jgi:Ankyrin repeats (3 copies)
MSAPALKRQKTSDAPVCSCDNIQAAARAQHLPCLRKFVASCNLSDIERSEIIDEALRLVTAHKRTGSSTQSRDRDCTGCLRALLDMQMSATAKTATYELVPESLVSLCAREGCTPCLDTLLAHYKKQELGADRQHWRAVLESVLSCSQLEAVQAVFRAVSSHDEKLQAQLGHDAVQIVLKQLELPLITHGSEQSHSECEGMLRVLTWLFGQGFTCENSDHDGTLEAVLSTMVKLGCTEGVRALSAEHRVDLTAVLHEACAVQYGSAMVRELVRCGADISTRSSNGHNVLQTAVTHGSTDTVKALLQLEKSAASTATTTAALSPQPFILQPFDDGDSILHKAVSKSTQLLEALLLLKDSTVATALQMTDSSGRTALHCAIELHRAEHVKLLLQAAVAVRVVRSVCDVQDDTGVDIACLVKRTGAAAVFKLLSPYISEVRVVTHALTCTLRASVQLPLHVVIVTCELVFTHDSFDTYVMLYCYTTTS